MQAFINALQSDDLDGNDAISAVSPNIVPDSPVPQSPRVRKVSALSDFAPINLKVKRCGASFLGKLIPLNLRWLESEREIRLRVGGKSGRSSCSDGHCS